MAVVCALAALASVALAQSPDVVARAASVNGQALLYSGGSTLALTAGYILNPGDRIDTRGGGRVVIDLSDGSMVLVQAETVLVLKDFRQASSLRELFDITVGLVRVKINHFGGRPNPYRMNSPTASIAVRGTEFSVEVGAQGDTQVVVYEGAVEVTRLDDPSRRILIEAGRGVLVQAGQDFRLSMPGNLANDFQDRDDLINRDHMPVPQVANGGQAAGAPSGHPDDRTSGLPGHDEFEEGSPRAVASTYDRYIAGLSDIDQVPFLFRYDAFAERYLDSLENPAMATAFGTGEGRIFLLPTFRGARGFDEEDAAFGVGGSPPADYSVSPQVSMFSPVGRSGLVLGGSFSGSQLGDGVAAGNSTSTFYSGALVAARQFGRNSIGVEVESLRGTGTLMTVGPPGAEAETLTETGTIERAQTNSRITQNRMTAGYSRRIADTATLGFFYRYAFISASVADSNHTVDGQPVGLNSARSTGHSSELGFRFRGAITPRLWYGAAGAWLGASLSTGLVQIGAADSHGRDRAQRGSLGIGLGYALTNRWVMSVDLAGGAARTAAGRTENSTGATLQNGGANCHFVSLHTAVQGDLTRHLFATASLLNVWQKHELTVDLFPDRLGRAELVRDPFFPLEPGTYPSTYRFSDFGVGWRFSRDVFLQYVYSTAYGASPASHTLMLRYAFRLRRE